MANKNMQTLLIEKLKKTSVDISLCAGEIHMIFEAYILKYKGKKLEKFLKDCEITCLEYEEMQKEKEKILKHYISYLIGLSYELNGLLEEEGI